MFMPVAAQRPGVLVLAMYGTPMVSRNRSAGRAASEHWNRHGSSADHCGIGVIPPAAGEWNGLISCGVLLWPWKGLRGGSYAAEHGGLASCTRCCPGRSRWLRSRCFGTTRPAERWRRYRPGCLACTPCFKKIPFKITLRDRPLGALLALTVSRQTLMRIPMPLGGGLIRSF
jgi:hypothetical protein